MVIAPYIVVTDTEWYQHLTRISDERRRVDEVNFWNPSGRSLKRFGPGEPVFFRLKQPMNAIAGYGFFAHFTTLRLDEAWTCFGEKNGAPNPVRLLAAIAGYRVDDPLALIRESPVIGCTVLRDAVFWEQHKWIPWGKAEGWHPSQPRGASERDRSRADRLLAAIQEDHRQPPLELVEPFVMREVDERKVVQAQVVCREGQGTFRVRLRIPVIVITSIGSS